MPPSPLAQPPPKEFVRPNPELRQAVSWVCDREPTFRTIEPLAGPLTVRCWPPGLASLVRIILGQQLSSKAAQAIFQRLTQTVELTPAGLAACPEVTLRQVGFSRAKIATCQRLAETMLSNQLRLEALSLMSDAEVVDQLTQIKGIGVWTAEVYALFCLGRLGVLPASDLAIQIGYQRLNAMATRPTRPELLALTAPLAPYGGAVAHLLWHYYRQSR
ncbi:MAG: DNA-3-methyladenine glycosylase family protein [Nodosilinea sp.]